MRHLRDEGFEFHLEGRQQDLSDFTPPFGVSPDYVPAIRVRGSRTFGRPTRLPGRKSKAVQQTLSTAETLAALLAEFDPHVLATFDQFPLPLPEYRTIRSDLGLRSVGGAFDNRLSVDFLLWVVGRGWVAVEVKRSRSDFLEQSVVENLTAKRILLDAVDIPLVTFARDDLGAVAAKTLLGLFAASNERVDREALVERAISFSTFAEGMPDRPLIDLLSELFDTASIEAGQKWFKKAVWHRLIPIDLNLPLRFDHPIQLTSADMGVHFPWSL